MHSDEINRPRDKLISQCRSEEKDARITATSFYLYLKARKTCRNILWITGAVGGILAAGVAGLDILEDHEAIAGVIVFVGSLAAVLMPGVVKAVKLDETITSFEEGAAKFKVSEKELSRCANVWSQKPYSEFEEAAKSAFKSLDEARSLSLTPPTAYYNRAKKIDDEYKSDSSTNRLSD